MNKKIKFSLVVFWLILALGFWWKITFAAGFYIGNEFLLGRGTPIGQVFGTLGSLVTVILRFLFAIASFSAFVMLIIGAYRYLFSGGDPKAVEDARNTITYAIIGLAIIIFAFVIVRLIGLILGFQII